MGEGGLSATEVGKELAKHSKHEAGESADRHDRLISIVEALVLAVVVVLAAWSGYSSAKWGTDSRLKLAQASTARTEATRANLDATTTKNFDASTFNTWFTAYVVNNQQAMAVAERRFRPEFKVAFNAWLATDPFTSASAPPGPTYMPQYRQPEQVKATALDVKADRLYQEGADAGGYADDYVRITVYLATVLFLVGIGGHFRFRSVRIGLIAVGSAILLFAIVLIIQAPQPPS